MKSPKRKMIRMEARALRIHPSAQRDLQPGWLKYLTKNLDLDSIGVIHVVETVVDGQHGFYVIDGQHRTRALVDAGMGEWEVDVQVHMDVQTAGAASKRFLELNKVRPVSAYARFQNEVMAENPNAVGALNVVLSCGLKVGQTTSDGQINCVVTVMKLYAPDAGKVLQLALDTAVLAWGTRATAMEGKLIEGLGLIYRSFSGSVDKYALIKKLSKYPGGPSGLLGDARGIAGNRRTTLSRCVGEIIVETYNSGRRSQRLDPL